MTCNQTRGRAIGWGKWRISVVGLWSYVYYYNIFCTYHNRQRTPDAISVCYVPALVLSLPCSPLPRGRDADSLSLPSRLIKRSAVSITLSKNLFGNFEEHALVARSPSLPDRRRRGCRCTYQVGHQSMALVVCPQVNDGNKTTARRERRSLLPSFSFVL
jgi:hypothetical protein